MRRADALSGIAEPYCLHAASAAAGDYDRLCTQSNVQNNLCILDEFWVMILEDAEHHYGHFLESQHPSRCMGSVVNGNVLSKI